MDKRLREMADAKVDADSFRRYLAEQSGIEGMIARLFNPVWHAGVLMGYKIAVDLNTPIHLGQPFKRRKVEAHKAQIRHSKVRV